MPIPSDILALVPEEERTADNLRWLEIVGSDWSPEKRERLADRLKTLYHKPADPEPDPAPTPEPTKEGDDMPDYQNPLDNDLIPTEEDELLRLSELEKIHKRRAQAAPPAKGADSTKGPSTDYTDPEQNDLIPKTHPGIVETPPNLDRDQQLTWKMLTPMERGQILSGRSIGAPGLGFLRPGDFGLPDNWRRF